MAETTMVSPLKRHREEEDQETVDAEETKRQKPSPSSSSCSSYDQILCLIEEEPDCDLTSLITTLQQEISPDEQNYIVSGIVNADNAVSVEEKSTLSTSSSCSCASKEEDDEGDREKVMRHLLEASDDELGIPSNDFGWSDCEINNNNICLEEGYINGFGDALWELEDEAANYYTLLQSELFMWAK